jgi:DtxR family manganese transport transcriptional regulator
MRRRPPRTTSRRSATSFTGITAKGERLAAESRRRHEIVFNFLVAIGVPETDAGPDAEGIEHHVGPLTLRCMEAFVEELRERTEEPG